MFERGRYELVEEYVNFERVISAEGSTEPDDEAVSRSFIREKNAHRESVLSVIDGDFAEPVIPPSLSLLCEDGHILLIPFEAALPEVSA